MKHTFWILAGLLAVLLLGRVLIRFYRLARAIKNIKVVRKPAPFPEPDEYLDDVFGKGNRP